MKQWLIDNGISDKTYYYWLRRVWQEAYLQMDPALPAVSSSPGQPAATFAEIPVPGHADGSFQADAMIRTDSMVIGISNSISDNLLAKLL